MKFIMQCDMDNTAFEPIPEIELADILDKVKLNALHGKKRGTIKDLNGNTVGHWAIIKS